MLLYKYAKSYKETQIYQVLSSICSVEADVIEVWWANLLRLMMLLALLLHDDGLLLVVLIHLIGFESSGCHRWMPMTTFNKFLHFLGVVLRMDRNVVGLLVEDGLVAAVSLRVWVVLLPGYLLLVHFYNIIMSGGSFLLWRDLIHIRQRNRKLILSFLDFVHSFFGLAYLVFILNQFF